MTNRPNALGRGIGALLPSAPEPLTSASEDPAAATALAELPVEAIEPNPEQPRRRFEPEQLQGLADSIRQHGMLQPVVVRRAGDGYQLVVGERRWRASRAAGLATIPAVIADIAPENLLQLALVENVQRHDLNPIELAHAFSALAAAGATQEEVGDQVGLDRSTIANHLRLLDLSRELQQDVEEGRLGVGHAKALLQISNPERRRQLRDRIVSEGLPVRAVEEIGRTRAQPRQRSARNTPSGADPNLQRVVDALRQRLQTRVRIQGEASRGRIEIEYFGDEDLQRLTAILLGDG